MTELTYSDRILKAAAIILDAEVRKIFGEGLDEEQQQVVECACDSFEVYEECCGMLDDMEARMGVKVDVVREMVNNARETEDEE